MDGHLFEGKYWIVRVDSGEDVLISLKNFIKEKGIKQGMVVMGYGTLAKVSMHWVCHNQWPPENNYHEWEGGIEIMGMNGMIVDGQPHIHFTASTIAGGFGGHMEEGCICYVLCEVGIVELEGAHLTREMVQLSKGTEGKPFKYPQLKFS
ncbi:PPC domain-containing DNA-binding protein [Candidatus Poribacteria bacterium]